MTPFAWFSIILLALACGYLAWRWRTLAGRQQAMWRTTLAAREEAERNAAENARLLRHLSAVEQVGSEAIFLIDENRTLQWMNKAAEAIGKRPHALPAALSQVVDSYEILQLLDQSLKYGKLHERQFNRDTQTYHATAICVHEQPYLVALVVADVTELQRLGRARRDFVANISHDLRTPITTIQVMAETLQGAAADSPRRRRELLAGITDQTATLKQLAQELLDLSLIESGRLPIRLIETPVERLLAPVVEQQRSQAEHKRITIHTDYDPELLALVDRDSIRRVLQNLMHNAIKFTQKGGEVIVGATAQGEDIRFMVRDSGPGISPEDLNRIFERFFKADRTRSEGGTGLGLAIARHIVEGHGGRIWVESEHGRGTTFFFTTPRA